MLRISLLIVSILTLPSMALASSVLRTGESVTITAQQSVEGDFYGLSNDVAISGEVTGDLLLVGTNITVNGNIGSDASLLGGGVAVEGVIGDDARIVAGEVTITGEVLGDLVVVAGSLKVLSTASVQGDIIFFGTSADIAGTVGKSIFGTSEKIRVDGAVGGDIDIKTTGLTLGEQADVTGVVKYMSAAEIVRAQNARVAGAVVKNDPVMADANEAKNILVPLLVVLFAALVWFLFFKRLLGNVVTHSVEHTLRSMLIGFGLFFLVPIAVGILVMSTLGSLLGITLFFAYFVLIFVTLTVLGITLGAYIAKLTTKKATVSIPYIVLGTSVAVALSLVPLVGPIVLLATFLITLGAVSTHLYRLVRFS